MIKALEALRYLDDIAHGRKMSLDPHKLELIVEKELKALDIIRKKGIILQFIKETYTVEQYNAGVFGTLVKPLTQEEYEILKEELE